MPAATPGGLPLEVPPRYYVDIDTPDDLERAAWILERTCDEIDLPDASVIPT